MQFTQSASRPDLAMGRGAMFREGGVDLSAPYESANAPPPSRAEMRGPQSLDLNGLLSGLKTREVNIHENAPVQMAAPSMTTDENDSMVSISSLHDAQNMNLPKRSNRRKQRSDRNTISLDI
jgi:hypothetical protein